MDMKVKQRFSELWKKYFNGAELPIIFYYTDEEGCAPLIKPATRHRCVIRDLARLRSGGAFCYDADSVGCLGGRRYLGFAEEATPEFVDFLSRFLSCGIPGELHGERYKKSPELVKQGFKYWPRFRAPARFIAFKSWEALEESDSPDVVVFFAQPDVLSGLFTLANFDEAEPNGVFTPFCAGCGSIVQYPYVEGKSQRPRGVIGMFDVSARPFVPKDVLSFSVPVSKFTRMVENMEESFLTTDSWKRVGKRFHPLSVPQEMELLDGSQFLWENEPSG